MGSEASRVTSRQEAPPGLREIAGRVAPVALAGTRLLPAVPALAALLPGGGLRRGSVIRVAGSTTIALAVLAGPSNAGSWTAIVGVPDLGGVALTEMGVDLARCAVVRDPGTAWPTVVGALLDGLDVVAVRPPGRVRAADARRLAARARERGAVLVVTGEWPEAPDVSLAAGASEWSGIDRGHGHLRHRRIDVVADGRGAASRRRTGRLEVA